MSEEHPIVDLWILEKQAIRMTYVIQVSHIHTCTSYSVVHMYVYTGTYNCGLRMNVLACKLPMQGQRSLQKPGRIPYRGYLSRGVIIRAVFHGRLSSTKNKPADISVIIV